MRAADHIDALVCGLPAHERVRRKLLMLTAYIDDSGTDAKGPFCVLAGYISDVERWKAFSDAWDDELHAPPKIAHFKMSEANNRRGPFWNWDEEARDRKVARLARIANNHAIGAIASIVSHKVYRGQAKGFLPKTIDNPYWLCFQKVVLETIRIYGNEGGGGKINFVFDAQGEGYERRALQILEGWRDLFTSTAYEPFIGSITFASDLDVLPLQAADLLAWHVRRRGDRVIQKLPEDCPVDEILGNVHIPLFGWKAEEIGEFVDWYQKMHPLSPINRPDLH